jgi:UDP:flavonoid glycosyltransferase YjiC (YdhE family)
LYPSIGIAQELRSRGHDVAFATDVRYSQFLESLGLRNITGRPIDGDGFQLESWFKASSVAAQVNHIEHALECFQADVLVGQSLTLGPLLVSELREIPVGLLGFCTYLWPTHDKPLLGQGASEREKILAWRHADMLKWFNQARSFLGLPANECSCLETPLLGQLYMLRNVPDLMPEYHSLPRRVHLVGSCLWEPELIGGDLRDWLAKAEICGRSLVYVQQGRYFHIPGFWRRLVEALEGSDCAVVASSDRMDENVGDLPEHFYVRPHVPQGELLSIAKVVVASANTTVTLGALSMGVPALLIPGGGEQTDVARFAERVGAVMTIQPEDVTPEVIARSIKRLVSDVQMRQRADHCKSSLSRIDGPKVAAGLLEILSKTRLPVLRDADKYGIS